MHSDIQKKIESISLEPGTYVVAVSGGVDSMTLLHVLANYINQQPKNKLTPKLVVAHFDHGIREDSYLDRKLVENTAKNYQIPFVYHEGKLGIGTNEATARLARYQFLKTVQQASNASAIITAHHQDDAVETAIINIYRGTGRRGITSLRSVPELRRPLLHLTKQEIIEYAKEHNLSWREDSTNADKTILRNYLRDKLGNVKGHKNYHNLIEEINKMRNINDQLDNLIELYLHTQPSRNILDRYQFNLLSHKLAIEILAEWLRIQGINTFNSKLLEDLVIKCKTLPLGKSIIIDDTYKIDVGEQILALNVQDR